jgi:hypothetical protein
MCASLSRLVRKLAQSHEESLGPGSEEGRFRTERLHRREPRYDGAVGLDCIFHRAGLVLRRAYAKSADLVPIPAPLYYIRTLDKGALHNAHSCPAAQGCTLTGPIRCHSPKVLRQSCNSQSRLVQHIMQPSETHCGLKGILRVVASLLNGGEQ